MQIHYFYEAGIPMFMFILQLFDDQLIFS